jgi:hypothetical protein
MELKLWSKTFLNVYRSLPKIAEAIDKIVLSSGLNLSADTYYTANKIIELTNRKMVLINLKLLIEETLKSLTSENSKLLFLKYADKLKSAEIAELFEISTRTYFRKNNLALKSFELALKREGHTNKSLKNMLKDEFWIMDLFNRFYNYELNLETKKVKEQKSKEDDINENKLINLAYSNYKKLETASMYA